MRQGDAYLTDFVKGFTECAVWVATLADDVGTPLDKFYSVNDLQADSLRQMASECRWFLEITEEADLTPDAEAMGHMFLLTRNHHGTGFGSMEFRMMPDAAGRLVAISHDFGECDLLVDNGTIVYNSELDPEGYDRAGYHIVSGWNRNIAADVYYTSECGRDTES